MKTARKVLMLVLCAALLVSATVMGTLAYLTDDDAVTNTFTVGKVNIKLDEAPTNTAGEVVDGDRRQANEYQLFPGHEYAKDPMVTVESDSENCYIYVTVDNGISDIEDQTNTIAAQMKANGWTLVAGETDVYTDGAIHKAGDTKVVFETFKIATDVKDFDGYTDAKITVKAYAVQADGFATADAAWAGAESELTA